MRKSGMVLWFLATVLLTAGLVFSQTQTQEKPYTGTGMKHHHAAGTQTGTMGMEKEKGESMSGVGSKSMTLKATLVDEKAKAQKKAATVKVMVTGVRIIDPALVNEIPKKGQGHFHYQVDNGPIIATTAPKLSFHDLSSGSHTIKVILAANDHTPLGPEETLTVTIP
jgi:hypothetical protein